MRNLRWQGNALDSTVKAKDKSRHTGQNEKWDKQKIKRKKAAHFVSPKFCGGLGRFWRRGTVSQTTKKGKITQEEYDRATAIYEKKTYGEEHDDIGEDVDLDIVRQHEMRKVKAKKRHKIEQKKALVNIVRLRINFCNVLHMCACHQCREENFLYFIIPHIYRV